MSNENSDSTSFFWVAVSTVLGLFAGLVLTVILIGARWLLEWMGVQFS